MKALATAAALSDYTSPGSGSDKADLMDAEKGKIEGVCADSVSADDSVRLLHSPRATFFPVGAPKLTSVNFRPLVLPLAASGAC